MNNIYRYEYTGAEKKNPWYPRNTKRPPGNIPYLVDNIWEWKRPNEFPSRRYSVFASPNKELVTQSGGAYNEKVYQLEFDNDVIAQIPQNDARFHSEAQGSTNLQKLVLRLLGGE